MIHAASFALGGLICGAITGFVMLQFHRVSIGRVRQEVDRWVAGYRAKHPETTA